MKKIIMTTAMSALVLGGALSAFGPLQTVPRVESVESVAEPIAPTTWVRPSIVADDSQGPGVFISHVPKWNYQTGEWGTEIWTHKLVRPGDMNGDLKVDTSDLGALITAFGTSGPAPLAGDINHDGVVDTADLSILLGEMQ